MSTILFYPKFNCEVGCEYCFQEKNLPDAPYDLEKMLQTASKLRSQNDTIILHGGEVFKLPIEDFEYAVDGLSKIYKKIVAQTSTYGLTDKHIDLMKKYKMTLGVSVDGPPELNQLRGPRDPEKNKEYQRQVADNISLLKSEKIDVGVICVLTKVNSVGEKLDILIEWILKNEISGRFNQMFLPSHAKNTILKELELSPEELKAAWLRLVDVQKSEPHLNIQPIKEFSGNLLGSRLSPCIIGRCDYLSSTCRMIMPDGGISRCDRALQEGYYYSSAPQTNIRSEVLKQTECKGCKYFEICGGGCPGEAIDLDFRHKTRFCEAYYGLYEKLENDLRAIPNIQLSIDFKNYFDEYYKKGRKINSSYDQGGNYCRR